MIYTFRHHRDKSNQKLTRHVFNRAGKFEFSKFKFSKLFCLGHLKFGHLRLFRISDFVLRIWSPLIVNNFVAILRTILFIRN